MTSSIMPFLTTVGIGLISIALMAIGWELAHKRNPLKYEEDIPDEQHDHLA